VSISKKQFGKLSDGREVDLYTLTNERGLEVSQVSIATYGGAIQSVKVADREGVFSDVVLGFETLDEYVKNPRYFGALIGRHANRIARGKFSLNGIDYQLEHNNGVNHLHGGLNGFDKRVWDATAQPPNVLRLSYLSRAGEENYPGNLSAEASYTLLDDRLRIDYNATTDADTIVNVTNHSYFNLKGEGTILDHQLTLHAESFTSVAGDLVPTGEIASVARTPMDFRKSKAIGSQILEPYDQLGFTGGYDHNFVLNDWNGSLRSVARLYEETSGRVLEVLPTQPGMQFYSGNFLDGSIVGKKGIVYQKYAGLCLEPQHFPDAPNHANFPSTALRREEVYEHTTVFRFSVE